MMKTNGIAHGDGMLFVTTYAERRRWPSRPGDARTPYGTLFDGGEGSLETNDDGGADFNFRIERMFEAGTYYFEVRGYESSTTGSYELNVSTTCDDLGDY